MIFLGPPGCGKTHLSISLGYAAINAGELTGATAGKSHLAHDGDVPDSHGEEMIRQVTADGGSQALIAKLKKIMGL